MSTVRISRKAAKCLSDFLQTIAIEACSPEERAFGELYRAAQRKPVKPMKRERLKAKAAKRENKNAETARIYATVEKRAGGSCEHCGLAFDEYVWPEMDHFWGRGKAKQSTVNCWLLARDCHRLKTRNFPSTAHWLDCFRRHCERHGFHLQRRLVEAKLDALVMQGRAVSP